MEINRIEKLLINSIKKFNLSLSGLTIFTEAATGAYMYTPIIAAIAGAEKVFAFTKDSKYGPKEKVRKETLKIAEYFAVKKKIDVIYKKRPDYIRQSDVITNTGFVRPIDKEMISLMKSTAGIPLMWEPWEFRNEDLDLVKCRKRGVIVLGTNEHHPLLRLDLALGFLVYKILLGCGLEVYNGNFLLISGCSIGDDISEVLTRNEVNFDRIVFDYNVPKKYAANIISLSIAKEKLSNYDAIIIAEHIHNKLIIGKDGCLKPNFIKKNNSSIKLIHLCGNINPLEIRNAGLLLFPDNIAPFGYLSISLAELGPVPIIELNTAGLKVGQTIARARLKGMDTKKAIENALRHSPAMDF